jgi:hypothetical protein
MGKYIHLLFVYPTCIFYSSGLQTAMKHVHFCCVGCTVYHTTDILLSSVISGTNAAISTVVVVARYNSR